MPSFKGFATAAFGGFVERYANIFAVVKESLPKANIRIAFRTYMSLILLVSVVVYFISLVITITAVLFIKVSFLMSIMFVVFIPVLSAVVIFLALTFYPLQKMSSRKKNIESNLPFVLTHMGAIAESGVPPYVIFRLISQFEEYGEISKEMGKIVRNIETFGIDPLTAVKEVADKTPSHAFKQTLLGFVTTTESGGNIKVFLKSAGDQALFDWRIRRERFLQQLSAYAEFYTGILIAAPLFIIALFSVMSMIQPTIGQFGILDLMKISIYLIVPILNGAFLLFLRGVEVEI
jgi:flagellar protein FlaJ